MSGDTCALKPEAGYDLASICTPGASSGLGEMAAAESGVDIPSLLHSVPTLQTDKTKILLSLEFL